MSITIRTERVVSRETGGPCRKLVGFELLNRAELPELYWGAQATRPAVWSAWHGRLMTHHRRPPQMEGAYSLGDVISEDKFQRLLQYVRDAGEHLREVNQTLRALSEAWNGEEVFEI